MTLEQYSIKYPYFIFYLVCFAGVLTILSWILFGAVTLFTSCVWVGWAAGSVYLNAKYRILVERTQQLNRDLLGMLERQDKFIKDIYKDVL